MNPPESCFDKATKHVFKDGCFETVFKIAEKHLDIIIVTVAIDGIIQVSSKKKLFVLQLWSMQFYGSVYMWTKIAF